MADSTTEWFWKSATSEVVTRIFELMGRKLPKDDERDVGNISLRFVLLLLINTTGITNSIILTYRFWTTDYKFDFILNSVVIYFQFCAIIHLIYFPHHYIFLFKVLDRKLYPTDEKFPLNEEQIELIRETNRREKKVHIMFLLFVLAWSLKSLLTMAKGIHELYRKEFDTIEDYEILMVYITIPLQKLFSNKIPAILVYVVLSTIQVVIFIFTLEMSANFCFLVTCVVKKLEAEIWILRQYIRRIDNVMSEDNNKQFYEINLKRYLNLCIKYHQAILR
ncbi:hypothetical protein LSTR_LSTR008308 [Laodelphax striatellus]|uniref:Odorant receptor n=1 Tax=Laodelphax striatellus TaxID=195883 RepID=A0A482XKZ4_LAOST|nr:hypothetical protein LSTR_LSTR008308 [Laodelphax striatellus]